MPHSREPYPAGGVNADRCVHGGAFFDAIGDSFDDLGRRRTVINADVLDAWFDPSPEVTKALHENLAWLLRTSPPTDCGGLLRTITQVRGIPEACVLPGAGSSDLMFLALPRWLDSNSRVLILDPSYGEYAHILTKMIGCHVDRIPLAREELYQPDLAVIERKVSAGFDLVLLVNPNSPTGRHIPRAELRELILQNPSTRYWIDETYVEFAGLDQSLESFAAASENVVVCKSMSKVYALSGARAGYLCGPARLISELRSAAPPWAISLPSQVAAVRALQDPQYYRQRYEETHALREALCEQLSDRLDLVPSTTNFVLGHLREDAPKAPEVIAACRQRGLFLRDIGSMSARPSQRAIRIAVKDAATNLAIANILRSLLRAPPVREQERSAGEI